MQELSESVAVVTGATRGIGREIALMLGRSGASVVVVGRSGEGNTGPLPGTVESVAAELESLGASCIGVRADLTDEEMTQNIVDKTLERFGRADIVVNNAAYPANGSMLEVPWHRWQRAFRLQVVAPMQLSLGFLPGMIERGHGTICNVSSGASQSLTPGLAVYSTSKLAMERWSDYLDLELDGTGIAVNTFRVDRIVKTEGWQHVADTQGMDVAMGGESLSVAVSAPEAAEQVRWMLNQPPAWSGHTVGFDDIAALGGP